MSFDRIYTSEIIQRPPKKEQSVLSIYHRAMQITESAFFSLRDEEGTLFARQAKILKNLEDQYSAPNLELCSERFPVYADLTLQALRSFISWRTQFRKGKNGTDPNRLFLMLAIEELSLPEYKKPEEALREILKLPALADIPDAKKIGQDFVIWNHLPAAAVEKTVLDFGSKPVSVLLEPEKYDDATFYEALRQENFPRFNVCASQNLYPALWKIALRYAWIELDKVCLHQKNSDADCWGEWIQRNIFLFHPRFYPGTRSHPDTTYIVNAAQRFSCRRGLWQENRCLCTRGGKKLAKILFDNLDRAVRHYKKSSSAYKIEALPSSWLHAFNNTVSALRRLETQCRMESIRINTSALDRIRLQAKGVEEKLVAASGDEMPAPIAKVSASPVSQTNSPTEETGLTAAQRAFLHALLAGEGYENILSQQSVALSVFVDTINEKLISLLGDAAISMTNGKPAILEDYREDIEKLL